MRKLLTLSLLLCAGALAWAEDGNSSQKTAPVGVQILKPISVKKVDDLFFGQLIVDAKVFRGGILTMYKGYGLSGVVSGGAWLKNNPSQKPHVATFAVTGEDGLPFGYYADAAINLTTSGGAPLSLATLFDKNPNAYIGGVGTGTLASTIEIGGLLTLPSGITPGTYSGTFTVHVLYL